MSPRLNSNVSGFLSGFPAQISEPDNNRISGINDIGPICRVCRVLFRDRELHRNQIFAASSDSRLKTFIRLDLNDVRD